MHLPRRALPHRVAADSVPNCICLARQQSCVQGYANNAVNGRTFHHHLFPQEPYHFQGPWVLPQDLSQERGALGRLGLLLPFPFPLPLPLPLGWPRQGQKIDTTVKVMVRKGRTMETVTDRLLLCCLLLCRLRGLSRTMCIKGGAGSGQQIIIFDQACRAYIKIGIACQGAMRNQHRHVTSSGNGSPLRAHSAHSLRATSS